MQSSDYLHNAWLYIAVDIRDLKRCKIGVTTRSDPNLRIDEGRTSNPHYLLFTAYDLSLFNIDRAELERFERYAHRHVGQPIFRIGTGSASEWRLEDPREAERIIDHLITKCFERKGRTLYDEDGAPKPEEFKDFKFPYRPDPFGLSIKSLLDYEECKEYIDFLMDHHDYPLLPKI